MTRLHRLNASGEYVYRVLSAVVFGSILSDATRLGDVDIAIELEPKATGETKFRKWCDVRRKLAAQKGTHFSNTVDWVYWPRNRDLSRTPRARPRTEPA